MSRRAAMAEEPTGVAVRADLVSHADILLGPEAEVEGVTADIVLRRILESVPVPKGAAQPQSVEHG